ncbi:MAG: hypothetical protein ACSHXI_19140 [Hoeflea sp.]|uniref:hypothetical protein n=1 Tax=Hoeflea sp. TaxID=1940281 RepID=UPI003EF9055F
MGRYFDTSSAVATVVTVATKRSKFADPSQQSQKSRGEGGTKFDCDNVIDLSHVFEERAAIMEFDGGATREEAERMAATETGFDPGGV